MKTKSLFDVGAALEAPSAEVLDVILNAPYVAVDVETETTAPKGITLKDFGLSYLAPVRMVCAECGAPYVREVEKTGGTIGKSWHDHSDDMGKGMMQVGGSLGEVGKKNGNGYQRIDRGFSPTCTCNASTRPGVVLDPFMGSGTTALVARAEGRDFLGCDLNPEYVAIAEKRLAIPYTPRLFFDDEVKG